MLPKSISKLKSTGRLLPIMSGIGLLAISYLLISPVGTGGENASAWVYGDTGDGGSTTTASVSMVFDKDTVTNEQVDVVAGTPVASEAKYFTITPSGSVEKYSIYVQTSSSNNGSLVASNANNNATIATLADKTTGVPLSSIGTNTWGYALSTGRQTTSSMLYKGLSGSTNAISAYDSAANPTTAQDFTLAFAANIGNDKPADHYIANVLVSVAANPQEITNGLMSIDYMQDLTPSLCKDSTSLATKQLIDTRDGKSYWVTKLKDNNCWMTQNLDYDGGGTPIIPNAWTTSGSSINVHSTTAVYYDHGMVGVSSTPVSDSHLLIGNYYSWAAASNGSGNGISSGNASGSICPSGWQLPSNSGNGSFSTLLNGVTASNVIKAPYYFIYSGFISAGSIGSAGGSGNYWSSTAAGGNGAYNLRIDGGSVNASNTADRYYGFPIRCLILSS